MENNIHILPTDKPSGLYSYKNNLFLTTESHLHVPSMKYQNISITSDEEIKEGDWYLDTTVNVLFKNDRLFLNGTGYKKIILTTDQDLIKYGVQAIDDEFLEWFVKNPSCEEIQVDKFISGRYFLTNPIIPKEEPKQETLEEVAERLYSGVDRQVDRMLFINGAKWQQERMYSDEKVEVIVKDAYSMGRNNILIGVFNKWFEQFKKK